jgi:hypothetical protein
MLLEVLLSAPETGDTRDNCTNYTELGIYTQTRH